MSLHPLGAREQTGVDPASVQVLRWPAEAVRRDPAHPCLWLLPVGELPPLVADGDAWVRMPVAESELLERIERLAAGTGGALVAGEVVVDADGRVERRGVAVHLPPIEAQILATLAAHPDEVVTRATLSAAVWGDHGPGSRALDSRIHALRGHIGPLGLSIHTIRARGFLLSAATPTTGRTGGPGTGRRWARR